MALKLDEMIFLGACSILKIEHPPRLTPLNPEEYIDEEKRCMREAIYRARVLWAETIQHLREVDDPV